MPQLMSSLIFNLFFFSSLSPPLFQTLHSSLCLLDQFRISRCFLGPSDSFSGVAFENIFLDISVIVYFLIGDQKYILIKHTSFFFGRRKKTELFSSSKAEPSKHSFLQVFFNPPLWFVFFKRGI